MRNILMILVVAISSTSFAMPSAFTELLNSGYWAGEAKYYHNDEAGNQFFYAAEISSDGKTFNTLTPPGHDPESRFQRYSLSNEGLNYSLRFNPERGTHTGMLTEFEEQENVWIFSKRGATHKYTKCSDTELLIQTFFGTSKHAEVKLTYVGSGYTGLMWVGIAQMQYSVK